MLLLALILTTSFAQTVWTKDPGNPVLTPGPAGTWNDFALAPGCLIFDGTLYHIWYSGLDDVLGSGTNIRIGYAVSPDGISWTEHSGNPILDIGAAGSWDDKRVYKPYVLFDGSTYYMWYTGYDGTNTRIGYATSPDSITWTKYAGNPVLDLGSSGSWDDMFVEGPSVIFDGNNYHMWYTGGAGPNTFPIGYATSPDGINWTKYAGNPVLPIAAAGSWDYPRAHAPDVIFDGEKYHMWYSGGSQIFAWRIGYATSLNGITWTKYHDNPVVDVGAAGSWDSQWVGFARVLLDTVNSQYKMWYRGNDSNIPGSFGYATAVIDGLEEIDFKRYPNDFVFSQNYPNPFNPITNIEFSIPKTEFVSLKIYNLLGQEVATLVSDKLITGNYKYEWDAGLLASGVYMYKIEAGSFTQTRKLILMK